MAKGKAKTTSSGKDSLAPPQPWSLRSRKRECPSDDISKTDDVQATLHHEDPLQASSNAVEPSCLTKQDPASEEKHAEATDVMVEASEGQEETTVTSPNNEPQLEGFRVDNDNNASKSGKDEEEKTTEECYRPPSQTCTDQLQVFSPISGDVDGSRATTVKEQLVAKERNQENSEEEPGSVSDTKEIRKEAAAGLPAKKKRRMGMCGLTEKERSHILQTQKRENGEGGPERVEKQIEKNTAEFEAQEEMISPPSSPSSPPIPVGSVREQNEAEMKLQSSQYGGDDRAETEVLVAVTASDGTSTVCDPGSSKGKSCEAEGGIAPGPEQTESDPPAAEEEEAEKPQELMKDGEDGSAAVDQNPAVTFYSNLNPLIRSHQNEETENDRGAVEADLLQVNTVTRTRDEELTGDAGAGASSTDNRAEGFNCGFEELCEAAVTPSGSERKDSRDPDSEPGASTPNSEHPQTGDTSDPFGFEFLDYVSDSQLNTITLAEEEVMERKRQEDLGSPDCHEDATDLICGLIRELSSLNQKVMATHRELENLRRGTNSSRGSIR